jgi:hypothetical protein
MAGDGWACGLTSVQIGRAAHDAHKNKIIGILSYFCHNHLLLKFLSRPGYRGVSDQRLQTLGRGAVAGGCVGDAALKNPPGGPSRSGPGARAARRGLSDGQWPAALSVAGRSDRSKRATCDDKAWARSLQRWSVTTRQRGRDERTTTWDVSGANLKHRARDAGELADLRFRHFDKPRCREASRCVGPARTRRSARPRFFRGAPFRRRPARGRKEYGR